MESKITARQLMSRAEQARETAGFMRLYADDLDQAGDVTAEAVYWRAAADRMEAAAEWVSVGPELEIRSLVRMREWVDRRLESAGRSARRRGVPWSRLAEWSGLSVEGARRRWGRR